MNKSALAFAQFNSCTFKEKRTLLKKHGVKLGITIETYDDYFRHYNAEHELKMDYHNYWLELLYFIADKGFFVAALYKIDPEQENSECINIYHVPDFEGLLLVEDKANSVLDFELRALDLRICRRINFYYGKAPVEGA